MPSGFPRTEGGPMRNRTLALLLGMVVFAGCASLRGPAQQIGPTLTIHNQSQRLLELGYRCMPNGAVRRLGEVPPQDAETFVVRPASCTTVHLVRQRPISSGGDPPTFAVVPIFDGDHAEVVVDFTGVVMQVRQRSASR
jgi:hypothetical protein